VLIRNFDTFKQTVAAKWEELAPLPVGRSASTAVLLHGLIYVGVGFAGKSATDEQQCYRLDVYDMSINQWKSSPISTPHRAYAIAVLDDRLVIAGGVTKSAEFTKKILFLDDEQWKNYNEMPTARSNATAVGYRNFLIVMGGKTGTDNGIVTALSTVELLNATNERWYICNNLPTPHYQLQAAVVDNTLYLLGGYDDNFKSSPQALSTSLKTLTTHQLMWNSLTDTPCHRSHPSVVSNGLLLAVGGRHSSDATIQSDEVHALNPSTGSWELIANIPIAYSAPAAVTLADNKVIILGGTTNSNQRFYSKKVWIVTFDAE